MHVPRVHRTGEKKRKDTRTLQCSASCMYHSQRFGNGCAVRGWKMSMLDWLACVFPEGIFRNLAFLEVTLFQ